MAEGLFHGSLFWDWTGRQPCQRWGFWLPGETRMANKAAEAAEEERNQKETRPGWFPSDLKRSFQARHSKVAEDYLPKLLLPPFLPGISCFSELPSDRFFPPLSILQVGLERQLGQIRTSQAVDTTNHNCTYLIEDNFWRPPPSSPF